MKPFRSILLSGLAVCGFAQAADSTHELRDSLLARGDFNGDGRPDIAVVERATGQVRAALTQADGTLLWGESNHSGIAPATGVATGRLLTNTREALAVTGTWSNRSNILDLTNPDVLPAPLSVFTSFTGPTGIAAAQVVNGDVTREELVICHTENGTPSQSRGSVRFNGVPLQAESFSPEMPPPPVPSLELRPRRIETLPVARMASFTGTQPTENFRLLRVGASPVAVTSELSGLPVGAQFVHADFDGAATTSPAQFVFFHRDEMDLRWCSLSSAGVFAAISTVSAGVPVEHVTALPKSGGGWMLVVAFSTGGAQIFQFNGQSAPVPGEVIPPASDGSLYQGAFASGAGDFHLLAGLAGQQASRADRFSWNGSSHAANGSSTMPELRTSRALSNVFAFSDDPFIATDAVLLGSFSAGEWSRDGVKDVSNNIKVEQARYANSEVGIQNFQEVILGTAPIGTNHVMTNQISAHASAYGPSPALGVTVGEVKIDPPPGHMNRSVRPRFNAPSGVNVFWRIGGDTWLPYPAQEPGWQFEAFSIQWFGRGSGGVTTPVQQGVYTFAEGPDTLDSDGDGVPDYVEIANGLDPVSSGDDGDADGASDLLELLSGTNPNDANESPIRPGDTTLGTPQFPGNYQNALSFAVTPDAIAGSSRYAMLGADGARVAIHELTGLQLGEANTAGVHPQSALLAGIPGIYAGSMLAAGTDSVFDLNAAEPDKRRGRELVGLLPVSTLDLGPVPHVYPGGNLAAAADAWVLAAKSHYSQPVSTIDHTLDASSTLRLLLVELKTEQILRDRAELGAQQSLSLTSFRSTETTFPLEEQASAAADAVLRIGPPEADALRRYTGEPPAFSYTQGWRIVGIDEAIGAGLASPPDAAVSRLLELTREIYFLSASASDATLPQFPSPVDALRRFLRTARLPGDTNADGIRDPEETLSYWGNLALSPAQVSEAHSAIATLLALPQPRPTTSGVFVVDSNTFNGPVPVVRRLPSLDPFVLLQGNGEPWPLAQFAPLATGAELTVTGFSDVSPPHAASAIEVITLSLTKLPAAATADADNNLLGDDWENLFPPLTGNPFADSDDDGISDLQEYLDGTDPTDPASAAAGGPVDLLPPQLLITKAAAPGVFRIDFQYPAAYAEKITFRLQQSPDLTSGFTDTGDTAMHLGGGNHRLDVLIAGPKKFWRVRLGLK